MSTVEVINNTIHSVKIILYKRSDSEILYLVLKEPEGLFGFVGGAKDIDDIDFTYTAKREILEELGLTEKSYTLTECDFTHEFVHTDTQSPRFGKKGIQHIYLAHYTAIEEIKLSDELLGCEWLPENQVFERLQTSYTYFKSLFTRAIIQLKTGSL